jgi:putative ABC transport system substrate-binding protein
VTGLQKLTPELASKRLELLKEAFPKASRVAVLWNPGYSDFSSDWREMRAAARVLGIALQSVEFRGPEELDSAFSAMASQGADALIMFSDSYVFRYRQQVVDLAAKHRLPAMWAFREGPDAGGLMDKILKGATPADLPVEQPTAVRARRQPQDRQGAWPDHPVVRPGPGGCGDSIKSSRGAHTGRSKTFSHFVS